MLCVALIFDDQTGPETTGVNCRRALEGLVQVEHFAPTGLDQVPRRGFDLYLNIDDGLRYRLPPDLRPVAWWAIDTHLNFDWCLERAHEFDFVFAAQRDGAARLRDEGIATTWLPLACDPDIHRKHDLAKTFDVCFVGHVFPGPRAELLDLIRQQFRNSFIGERYFDEMAQTYSAARIVFNRSILNDVNMRVFEALACGSLLVTNDLRDNGQAELFQDGVHLATYREPEELLDKLRFYLRHGAVRERIAAAGRREALARHTYRLRMEQPLADVHRQLSRTTAPAGPERECHAPTPEQPAAIDPPVKAEALPASPAEADGFDPSYFDFARPELLALIPPSARRVVDIGCGAGRLGEALKARQPAEVVGVELVEAAARLARGRLDQVLVGDVETLSCRSRPARSTRSFAATCWNTSASPNACCGACGPGCGPMVAWWPASPTSGTIAWSVPCSTATGPMNRLACWIAHTCASSPAEKSSACSRNRGSPSSRSAWSRGPVMRSGAGWGVRGKCGSGGCTSPAFPRRKRRDCMPTSTWSPPPRPRRPPARPRPRRRPGGMPSG
jgi:hypothetical protein